MLLISSQWHCVDEDDDINDRHDGDDVNDDDDVDVVSHPLSGSGSCRPLPVDPVPLKQKLPPLQLL